MKISKRLSILGFSLALLLSVFAVSGTTAHAKEKVLKNIIEFDPVSQQPTGYLNLNIGATTGQLQLALVDDRLAFVSTDANGVMTLGIDEGFSTCFFPVNVAPGVPSVYLAQYVFGDIENVVLQQSNKSYIRSDVLWTLDAAGNPIQVKYTDQAGNPFCTITCKYDALGRLTEYNSLYEGEQERHDTTKFISYAPDGKLDTVICSYNDQNGAETYVGTFNYRCIYDADGFITDYVCESDNSIWAYLFIYE